jgi:hypothetical protein
MALQAIMSNRFKYALANAQIDLDTHTIKCILMRANFVYSKDTHGARKNIKGTTGSIAMGFDNALKKITRLSGSFITDGFVPGSTITIAATASNDGNYTISSSVGAVTAGEVLLANAPTLAGGTENGTMTATDEFVMTSGSGYAQDTMALVNKLIAQNNTDDRLDFTCDDVTWTAAGGTIGPSAGAILYDDTDAEKTIIGFLDFGGNQSATDGVQFVISGIKIRIV